MALPRSTQQILNAVFDEDNNVLSTKIDASVEIDQNVEGDIAHDAADEGNPVKVGGKAHSSTPTAVANNDRVNAYFDVEGRQVVHLDKVTGTDGSAGPANTLSVGGTQATGEIEEVRVDSDGHLQVDVLSGGGGATDTDDDSVAAGQTLVTGINLLYGYDGSAWERLQTDTNGALDVNVTTALPAGTNAIGKLAANSGVDIGDVTLTAGTAEIGKLGAGTAAIGKLVANTGVDIGDVTLNNVAADESNGVIGVVMTPISASTYSPSYFGNFGASGVGLIKTAATNVFSLACHNDNSANRFIQLHDVSAASVSAGDVPDFAFLVAPEGQTVIGTDFFTQAGVNFTNGCAFAFSSTKDSYAAGVAADQSTVVMYK